MLTSQTPCSQSGASQTGEHAGVNSSVTSQSGESQIGEHACVNSSVTIHIRESRLMLIHSATDQSALSAILKSHSFTTPSC